MGCLWHLQIEITNTVSLPSFPEHLSPVQFSCSVLPDSLQSHGPQHARPPSPSPTPGVYTNSHPLSRWCHPNISSSVVPFSSCLQSFPASRSFPALGSFPQSWLFKSGDQSIGASISASVLPVNIQGGYPIWLTGLTFLLSKGLSRVFSNTTIQKHQFFGTQPSLWSSSHIIHDYCNNHNFDYTDLCRQSDVSAF